MVLKVTGEGINEMGLEFGEPRRMGRICKDLCGRMNKETEECQRAAGEPGADQSSWTETWQSTGGDTQARNQLVSVGGLECSPWHLNGISLATGTMGFFFFFPHDR